MVSIYQNIKIIAVQQNSMNGQNGIPTKYIEKETFNYSYIPHLWKFNTNNNT